MDYEQLQDIFTDIFMDNFSVVLQEEDSLLRLTLTELHDSVTMNKEDVIQKINDLARVEDLSTIKVYVKNPRSKVVWVDKVTPTSQTISASPSPSPENPGVPSSQNQIIMEEELLSSLQEVYQDVFTVKVNNVGGFLTINLIEAPNSVRKDKEEVLAKIQEIAHKKHCPPIKVYVRDSGQQILWFDKLKKDALNVSLNMADTTIGNDRKTVSKQIPQRKVYSLKIPGVVLLAGVAVLGLFLYGRIEKNENLWAVRCSNGLVGFATSDGKVHISPQFEFAWEFSEGLAPVRRGGQWGFIDKTGKFVIPLQFEFAWEFSEGLAPVEQSGGQWGFIEGLAPVKRRGQWGFIDKTGGFIIPPQFEFALEFSEGLAPVEQSGGQWGFIDKTGKFVIRPQFEWAREFSEGLAPVKRGGQWGFIDKTGKFVIPPQFEDTLKFSEGLVPVKTGGQWGFIDKTGKFIIPPQFEGAGEFSEGLAPVEQSGGQSVIIDKSGKIIMPGC